MLGNFGQCKAWNLQLVVRIFILAHFGGLIQVPLPPTGACYWSINSVRLSMGKSVSVHYKPMMCILNL